MPASPNVVSANVSNVKVDGEIIPCLLEACLSIEGGQIKGTVKVRNTFKKFDSLLIEGTEAQKSFQIVIELKKSGETIQTFVFSKCYLKNKKMTLDANGETISEYNYDGSVSNGKPPTVGNTRTGTYALRPQRIGR